MKIFFIIVLTMTLMVAGCTDTPKTDTDISSSQKIEIAETAMAMTLAWEDLMPVGEEALLAQMYTDYYENLKQRMLQQAQRLQDVNDEDSVFDINNVAEGDVNDTMEQIGTFNVVSSLNNIKVRIPGYVVPLDFSADDRYKEFLLVPYFGACLHTPPPPPNQIVFVQANPPVEIKTIHDPVWLEGVLKTGEFSSELADTAYELNLSKIEAYEY